MSYSSIARWTSITACASSCVIMSKTCSPVHVLSSARTILCFMQVPLSAVPAVLHGALGGAAGQRAGDLQEPPLGEGRVSERLFGAHGMLPAAGVRRSARSQRQETGRFG